MPNGFVGQACKKYLTTVQDAMADAHEVHLRDPYGASAHGPCTAPALPPRININVRYHPDTASGGGYVTQVGNESNVVVDQNTYDEILQRINAVDARIAEELYNTAVQIEEMCRTIYIVPTTLPKYLAILDKVKSSLGQFQTLTEDTRLRVYRYVDEIISIDRRM